jgi:hypothetical protein
MKYTWSINVAPIRFLILGVCMFATACMANNTENAWYGQYEYFSSGGETVGGSQIMLDITLKIDKQGGKESCQLNADGYQTYDRILCTTAVKNNRLTLQFKSYADGKIANEIGVERYKVGETLFSLEKSSATNDKKQNRYIPHWGAYTPFGIKRKNMKDYFEKVK